MKWKQRELYHFVCQTLALQLTLAHFGCHIIMAIADTERLKVKVLTPFNFTLVMPT